MLAVRIRLRKDGIPYEHNQCDGMMIADAGSFDSKEQLWLQTRESEPKKKEIKTARRAPEEVVRIKPKRFG